MQRETGTAVVDAVEFVGRLACQVPVTVVHGAGNKHTPDSEAVASLRKKGFSCVVHPVCESNTAWSSFYHQLRTDLKRAELEFELGADLVVTIEPGPSPDRDWSPLTQELRRWCKRREVPVVQFIQGCTSSLAC